MKSTLFIMLCLAIASSSLIDNIEPLSTLEASEILKKASDSSLPLGYQPNIVFLLTDDQDTVLGKEGYSTLGSLEGMDKLQKLLMAEGATFENYFVNTPICCPSRTEFFTGRYFHNVKGENGKGCMHANTTLVAQKETGIFGRLSTAGYNIGLFGKVTNDESYILPALAKQNLYYIDSPVDYNNYHGLTYYHSYTNNQTIWTEKIDKNDPIYGTTYQTTQIGNRTLNWLDIALNDTKPFFAYLGPHAPHYPATPADWYFYHYEDMDMVKTPNYNHSCAEKAQHVRQNPAFTEDVYCWENQHFKDRWSTLLSVDDVIEAVIEKIEKAGKMNETYFFYTSDHGYKLGQWRIGTSKQHPYETDIRIPFIVRGPGIPKNTTIKDIGISVDVLPTILELATGEVPSDVDGHSLASFLVTEEKIMSDNDRQQRNANWRTKLINEYWSVGTYYNDHSDIAHDGNTTAKCGPKPPVSPYSDVKDKDCKESTGVGDGNCYFVDSTHSNTWRALRILNATHNLQYVEYEPKYEWDEAQPYQHYELYDIAKDPYQFSNIYSHASDDHKSDLHKQLADYYACKNQACP